MRPASCQACDRSMSIHANQRLETTGMAARPPSDPALLRFGVNRRG